MSTLKNDSQFRERSGVNNNNGTHYARVIDVSLSFKKKCQDAIENTFGPNASTPSYKFLSQDEAIRIADTMSSLIFDFQFDIAGIEKFVLSLFLRSIKIVEGQKTPNNVDFKRLRTELSIRLWNSQSQFDNEFLDPRYDTKNGIDLFGYDSVNLINGRINKLLGIDKDKRIDPNTKITPDILKECLGEFSKLAAHTLFFIGYAGLFSDNADESQGTDRFISVISDKNRNGQNYVAGKKVNMVPNSGFLFRESEYQAYMKVLIDSSIFSLRYIKYLYTHINKLESHSFLESSTEVSILWKKYFFTSEILMLFIALYGFYFGDIQNEDIQDQKQNILARLGDSQINTTSEVVGKLLFKIMRLTANVDGILQQSSKKIPFKPKGL